MSQLTYTLPRKYFASQEIYQEEVAKIFRREWFAVGRVEQIAKAGQYFLVPFGQDNIIVLRDNEGQVQAFHNVCRHRGTRLCSAESGQLKKTIQCPYHAWTYALNGQLIGAPGMNIVSGFDKADFPLHSVPVHVWGGMIFINLSNNKLSFETIFGPDKIAFFAPWQLDDLQAVKTTVYDVKANWKIIFQNYSECYHCPIIHPEYSSLSHFESGETLFTEGSVLGGTMIIDKEEGGITLDGKMAAPPFAGIVGQKRQEVHFYTIFPNMMITLAPDHVVQYRLQPLAKDHTIIHCSYLWHRDQVAQDGFNPESTIEVWDITNRQDWPLTEQTQLGVQSSAYTPSPYYDIQEQPLHYIDQMVLQKLGHL
ncbi:MAG: aromatic ring-hydroxylating oxygenase subunit alpha [Ardenticatenaceae bacterium]